MSKAYLRSRRLLLPALLVLVVFLDVVRDGTSARLRHCGHEAVSTGSTSTSADASMSTLSATTISSHSFDQAILVGTSVSCLAVSLSRSGKVSHNFFLYFFAEANYLVRKKERKAEKTSSPSAWSSTCSAQLS